MLCKQRHFEMAKGIRDSSFSSSWDIRFESASSSRISSGFLNLPLVKWELASRWLTDSIMIYLQATVIRLTVSLIQFGG